MSAKVVDRAAIGGRKMLLPGEVSTAQAVEKSAEAIVGFGNEPSQKRRRTHRKAEGLNVGLSKIRYGSVIYP